MAMPYQRIPDGSYERVSNDSLWFAITGSTYKKINEEKGGLIC